VGCRYGFGSALDDVNTGHAAEDAASLAAQELASVGPLVSDPIERKRSDAAMAGATSRSL